MTALSVRGVTVVRGGRTVLEDVSFSAPPGELTCLLGPAGAGKTSLLAAIAGLLPVERGAVFLDGADITGVAPRRRGLALLPPGTILSETRTVEATLKRLAGRSGAVTAGEDLEALGLTALAGRQVGQLSHGQAALVLGAARLSLPGRVKLVDEAGAGLDAAGHERLRARLRTRAASGSVLLATRSPGLALSADHLVLLSDGRVLQAGAPASLYAEPRDEVCARLTGPANIIGGMVRELRPGGFVWASGSRHVQAADPHFPRPVLGSPVVLCLRPERLVLLAPGQSPDNVAEGTILEMRPAGALLDLTVLTTLGVLQVAAPSWGLLPCPATGTSVRLGWAADAATVLATTGDIKTVVN